MSNLQVGAEVLSFCGKCKLPLMHTIVNLNGTKIGKLKCNTCGSYHGYRSPTMAKKATKKVAEKEAPRDHQAYWQEHIGRVNNATKINYTVNSKIKIDDVLNHPTFGVGFVIKAIGNDKVEVVFEAGLKTLIHSR